MAAASSRRFSTAAGNNHCHFPNISRGQFADCAAVISALNKKWGSVSKAAYDKCPLGGTWKLQSTAVWAELLHSARKYEKREVRERRIELTLDPFACLAFDLGAARHYARIRDKLESEGQTIGGNDLMIAATASAHGLIVVTNNSGEFNRVDGLVVEDWSV
jgi:tRNA(fMet)-specific endonuclease VapC